MDRNMRLFAILFLTVLLATAEMGGPKAAEARTCESQSHRFKGPCISKTNCGSVCRSEGFPGGKCRGLGRRCYCVKNC